VPTASGLAFNFWVNQRVFLAAVDEDGRPLRKAWSDLAALPSTAQWAEFLRVHDELDLGRLTPEERERCYQAFGPLPEMRLYERGIRRRLASMLQGDRRRIELMNSRLFTLQGTPVIRYARRSEWGRTCDCRSTTRFVRRCSGQPNQTPAFQRHHRKN
jgi:maltose alpha-D-glucosyltransferase/alpha-amylase